VIFGDKSIQFVVTGEKHHFLFYPDLTAESFPAWTARRAQPKGGVICEVQAVAGSGSGQYGPAAPCRHLIFHNYMPHGQFQDKTSGSKDYRIPCYFLDTAPGWAGCKAWPLEWLKYPCIWYDADDRRVHLLAWVNLGLCDDQSYYSLGATGHGVLASDDYVRATDEIINAKQCLVGSLDPEGQGPIFPGEGGTSCYCYGRHKTKNVTRAIVHCEGEVFEVVGRLNDTDIENIVFFYKPYIVAEFSDQGPSGPVSDIFPELRVDDARPDKEYFNVSSRVGTPCCGLEGDFGDLFTIKQFVTSPYRMSLKMLPAPDPRGGIIVDSINPMPGNHGLLRDVFLLGKGHTMLHINTLAHFNYRGLDTLYGPIDFRTVTANEMVYAGTIPQQASYYVRGWMGPPVIPEERVEPIRNLQRNDECKERGGPSRDPGDQTVIGATRDLSHPIKWAPIVPIPLQMPQYGPIDAPTPNPAGPGPIGPGPLPGGTTFGEDGVIPPTYDPNGDDVCTGPRLQPFPGPDDCRNPVGVLCGRTTRDDISGTFIYVDEFGAYDGRDPATYASKFEDLISLTGPYFKATTSECDWLQIDETQMPGYDAGTGESIAPVSQQLAAIWGTLRQFAKLFLFLFQRRQVGLATVTSLNPLKIIPCNKGGQTTATIETEVDNISPGSVVLGERVMYFRDCESSLCVVKIPQGFTGIVTDGDFSWPGTTPGTGSGPVVGE